jgi:hypothetical protein
MALRPRRRARDQRQLDVFGSRPERSSIVADLLSRRRKKRGPISSGAQLGTELLSEGLDFLVANKAAKKEVARFDAAQATLGEALRLRTEGQEGREAVLGEGGLILEAGVSGFEGGSPEAQQASIALLLQNPDTAGFGNQLQQQFLTTKENRAFQADQIAAAQQREDDILERSLMREDVIRAEDRAARLQAAQADVQARRNAVQAQRDFDAEQAALDRGDKAEQARIARDIKAGKPATPEDARTKFIESDIALGDTLGLVGDLVGSPGLEAATGQISSLIPTLRDETSNFESDLDTLKSRLTFEALSDLKKGGATFGALSDNELRAISSSAKNLSLNQSEEKLRENLSELQTKLSGSRERVTDRFIEEFGGIDPQQFTRKLRDGSSQIITADGVQTISPQETAATAAEADEDERFNEFVRRKRRQRR